MVSRTNRDSCAFCRSTGKGIANLQDHEKDMKLLGWSDTNLRSGMLTDSLRTLQILDTLVGGTGHVCGGENELQTKKVLYLYHWFNAGGPADSQSYWASRRMVVSTELIIAIGSNLWRDIHPTLVRLEDNMAKLSTPSFHRDTNLKKFPALTGPDWTKLPGTWDEVMKLYRHLFRLYSDVYGSFWFVILTKALDEYNDLRNTDPLGFFSNLQRTTEIFHDLLIRAQLRGLSLVTTPRDVLFNPNPSFDADLAVRTRPSTPLYAHVKAPTDVPSWINWSRTIRLSGPYSRWPPARSPISMFNNFVRRPISHINRCNSVKRIMPISPNPPVCPLWARPLLLTFPT